MSQGEFFYVASQIKNESPHEWRAAFFEHADSRSRPTPSVRSANSSRAEATKGVLTMLILFPVMFLSGVVMLIAAMLAWLREAVAPQPDALLSPHEAQ